MYTIANIILSNATRVFDKEYYYSIPEQFRNTIIKGIRVIIPFGTTNRLTEGFILELIEISDEQYNKIKNIKEIKNIIDEVAVISNDLIALIFWMKKRYICTFYDALKCMIPSGINIKNKRVIQLIKSDLNLSGINKKIVDILLFEKGELEYEVLCEKINSNLFAKSLNYLKESNIIKIKEEFIAKIKDKYLKVAYLVKSKEEIIDDIESNKIRKIQYIRILEMLLETEY